MGDNIMAIIITEDGSFELEEGLSGVIHETAEAVKSRQRDEEDRELDWKQKFFQEVVQKMKSRQRVNSISSEDDPSNILERGWKK